MTKTKNMDLTTGSVSRKLILFFLPIMLGNVLQTLYSAADKVVVGQFAENGALALAAVGGTTSAIHLLIGLFNGLSVGANVICANLMGARKDKELRLAMHTAVLTAGVCGVGIGICAFIFWVRRLRCCIISALPSCAPTAIPSGLCTFWWSAVL